jgi:hypothetical protein
MGMQMMALRATVVGARSSFAMPYVGSWRLLLFCLCWGYRFLAVEEHRAYDSYAVQTDG